MYEETTEIIQKRLIDNWTETPIDFDGIDFSHNGIDPFIRVQVEWAAAEGIVGGMGKTKGSGYLLLSVFTRWGNGTKKAERLAGELKDLFQFYQESSLDFEVAVPRRIGRVETSWYQFNIEVGFVYNECN